MWSSAKTTAAIVVVIAFITGLLSGVAGDRFYLIRNRRLVPRHTQFGSRYIVQRLDRELHLTDPQKVAIQKIVEERHARIEAISGSIRTQIRQELDAGAADIDRVLTPEQRTKFHEMHRRGPFHYDRRR